jgi:hypothetical protein
VIKPHLQKVIRVTPRPPCLPLGAVLILDLSCGCRYSAGSCTVRDSERNGTYSSQLSAHQFHCTSRAGCSLSSPHQQHAHHLRFVAMVPLHTSLVEGTAVLCVRACCEIRNEHRTNGRRGGHAHRSLISCEAMNYGQQLCDMRGAAEPDRDERTIAEVLMTPVLRDGAQSRGKLWQTRLAG